MSHEELNSVTELEGSLQRVLDETLNGLAAHGHRAKLLTSLRDEICRRANEQARGNISRAISGHAAWEFKEAISWVDELQNALNPICRDDSVAPALRKALGDKSWYAANPKDWLFPWRNLSEAITKGQKSEHYWRVDMDLLSACANTYVRSPWGNVPWIERMIASAFVYAETLAFAENVRGKSILGAMFGQSGQVARSFVIAAIYLGIVAFVFLGAADAVGGWAAVVAALLTYRLLSFSPTLKEQQRVARLFGDMAGVYQIFGHDPVAPALVRERLMDTSNRGAVWPAGLVNVVERACDRNRVFWG